MLRYPCHRELDWLNVSYKCCVCFQTFEDEKTKLDWIRYIVLLPMGYMRSAFNMILVIKPVVKSCCVHSIMYSLVLLQ